MTHYTASHWGIYEVAQGKAGPSLQPLSGDPDPSPIGLHQLSPELLKTRVARPAVRRSWLEKGPGSATHLRGREPFVEVGWDEALDLLAAELRRVRKDFGNSSIFGGSYGWASAGRFHHAQSQLHRFLNVLGGYVRHVDSYSLGAGRVIIPHVVGPLEGLTTTHTSWDVMERSTELFVTFGGVPAKNSQLSSGLTGHHRVRDGLHRLKRAGVHFVNVSPVRDNLDCGGAFDWVPLRPNSDTAFMLGLAWVLHDEKLLDRAFLARWCEGFDVFERYLTGESDGQPKDPAWASAITGVAAGDIVALAREMAAKRTMLNIAWSLQRATHGEQPFWMLVTLAAMLGQIGLPGGGFGLGYGALNSVGSPYQRFPGPTFSQGRNAVEAFIPVARIADMLLQPGAPFTYNGRTHAYPDIRLVYWAGGNPFHHHQDLNRLVKAWQKPETIVVNEPFWTATAKHADIVLPVTTTLERDDIGYATGEGRLVAMKAVVEPFGEARDDYRIFAALAERLGVAQAFTEGLLEPEWLQRLYEESRTKALDLGVVLPEFDEFWEKGLIELPAEPDGVIMLEAFRRDPEANPLPTPSGRIEIFSRTIDGFRLADCPGHPTWIEPVEWTGGGAGGTALHLLSDQPVRRLHSQLDASPHSVAGKVQGREPVYMSPADAAARGIADGDVVELSNSRGRCLAAAVVSADIMPGVARLATGAWYDPDPESGLERHGNPNAVTLDRGASSLSQGSVAQTCLVEIRGPVNELPEIAAFDPPELVGR